MLNNIDNFYVMGYRRVMSSANPEMPRYLMEARQAANSSVSDNVVYPEVKLTTPLPEFQTGAPDQLWNNLGLYPGMRDNLERDAFTSASISSLGIRLDMLSEHTLRRLAKISPKFTQGMINEIYSRLPDVKTTDATVYGAVIAFEAYQIASGLDILSGFGELTEEDATKAFGQIPTEKWWKLPRSVQMINRREPESFCKGLVLDAQQIARYAESYPTAMGIGAWMGSRVANYFWPRINASELPRYQASRYADLNNLNL